MRTYQLGDVTDDEPPVDPGQEAPAIDAPDAGPPDEAQPFIDQTIAQPLTAPVSGQMPDEWPPPVPGEAPGMVPTAPVPGAPDAPAAPPTTEANIRAEGETAKAQARMQEQQALQAAAEVERHQQEQERIRLETEQRQQEAQDRLDSKISAYDKDHTLRDPRSSWTAVDKSRNMAAVIFGGLGGAFSAAGGGPGGNHALDQINKRLEQETERQKFNIQQASDQVVMARAGVRDAGLARAELLHNEDAKHVSRLNTIIAQGAATMSANGVPKAQQATDARIVALQGARDAAKEKAQLDAAKLAEIQARTALYNHKAGKGGGAGGGGQGGALATISSFIKQNPDDQPGAYALAERMGYHGPKGAALVDKLQNDFKRGKADKADDEATAVRDEDGNVIGHVPTGRGGAQGFATRDADYARAQQQLQLYQEDIAKNGERVYLPEAVKRRQTLKHNADIAVATVSPLGKTDEAMKAEAGSIGSSGAYSLTGANPEAIANKLKELREQQHRYRKETLIPAKAGPAAPAGGGGGMVTIKNGKTGETKRVTREEAQRLGAI